MKHSLTRRISQVVPESRLKNILRLIRHPLRLIPDKRMASFLKVTKQNLFHNEVMYNYSFHKDELTLILKHKEMGVICVEFPAESRDSESTFLGYEVPGYLQKGLIKKGGFIIDAGAWPGDFTTIASHLVGPKGLVVAFEPNPENRAYLDSVLKANIDHDNVIIVEKALYDSTGSQLFQMNRSGSSLTSYMENYKKNGEIEVETVTLDDFLEQSKLRMPDVIKMDIEGAELEAVSGAKKTIKKGHPAFLIASYHIRNGHMTHEALEVSLKEMGYDVDHLYARHPTTYAIHKG